MKSQRAVQALGAVGVLRWHIQAAASHALATIGRKLPKQVVPGLRQAGTWIEFTVRWRVCPRLWEMRREK